jgi:hypothetical protein
VYPITGPTEKEKGSKKATKTTEDGRKTYVTYRISEKYKSVKE